MPDNREKMQGQQGKSSSSQHAMDKDDNSQKNKQAGSRSADQRQTMKGGSKKSNK